GLRALDLPQADLRTLRTQVDQLESPFGGQLVAIRQRLGEMMKRVEKEHGNIRSHLANQARHDDAVGLKARRDAGRSRVGEGDLNGFSSEIDHVNSSSRALRTASAASSSDPAFLASCAMRSAQLSGAWCASGVTPSGSVIMPAPQVKCVAGSIRMKLPVARLSR